MNAIADPFDPDKASLIWSLSFQFEMEKGRSRSPYTLPHLPMMEPVTPKPPGPPRSNCKKSSTRRIQHTDALGRPIRIKEQNKVPKSQSANRTNRRLVHTAKEKYTLHILDGQPILFASAVQAAMLHCNVLCVSRSYAGGTRSFVGLPVAAQDRAGDEAPGARADAV